MKPKVYFTKEITPESLIKIYEALGVELDGKVAVKVSTGERGAKGYLKADLIAPLVKKLNGTIVECNTAYDGARNFADEHLEVAKEHGFDFTDIDIMDADGDMKIPVKSGKHLKYDLVGKHLENYDSVLNLAHGKGHAMGGFGANLKNQSIGIASRNGKAYIHSAGKSEDAKTLWNNLPAKQLDFIESMAEAAKAVADYCADNGKKIVYITVMNAISEDCDCDAHQGDPVMADLGIVGSLDPVANDQAFLDMVWNSEDSGKDKLIERITSREGEKITKYAEQIGLGSTDYELVEL